ncbi:MAG: hypothetical protein Q8Q10_04875 [bacterium]|nr:hypothetical protein [bacterium]
MEKRRLYTARQHMRERFIDMKKLIDPWSVPHFLFGVAVAFSVIVFDLPVFTIFFAVFFLALLWERLEQYFRLREAPENVWMDILLPLIAFTTTFFFANGADMSDDQNRSLLVISILVYIFVNFFAWRARFEHDRDFQG